MKLFYIIFLSCLVLSCQTENRSNPRVYVEGNLRSTVLQSKEILVTIKSDNSIIAETVPSDDGSFILSGPLLIDNFSLVFNSKIKSFKSSKSGCTVSPDSFQILVPAGTTYLTFTEIVLE